MVEAGVDPIAEWRRAEQAEAEIPTFGAFAIGLVDRIESGFSNAKHRQQWRNTLETYCGPIWAKPIDEVDTSGVLACLMPIWQAKPETASRVRGRIERVLNAAKAERLRTGENPAAWRGHLDATLPKPEKPHPRPSRRAGLCRHARVHGRPARPPGAGGDGAGIGDTDRDAHKRSLESPMDRIRLGRGRLDHPGGTNEGAPRASRSHAQAGARHRQRPVGPREPPTSSFQARGPASRCPTRRC